MNRELGSQHLPVLTNVLRRERAWYHVFKNNRGLDLNLFIVFLFFGCVEKLCCDAKNVVEFRPASELPILLAQRVSTTSLQSSRGIAVNCDSQ